MKRLLQAYSLALEEEEMKNRPQPFMRSHQSNKTVEQHQQPQVEKQSTKKNSSNLQVIISQAQSLNEVMKPVLPIPSLKEEKPQLVHVCN